MITWMLFAVLASALIAGAALAVEEVARLLGRPRRWGWMAGLSASVLLPLAFRFLPADGSSAPSAAAAIDPELLSALLARSSTGAAGAGALERILASPVADPLLLGAWITLTAAMGLALGFTYRRLRQVRASGARVEIAGLPALLTSATGPLVVGVRRPEIIVPRWVETLSEEERRLVVRHEWEHVRAGDPRLLLLGALLLAAMPWNLPLWWMRRRLRQAVEVDCDARVLATGADRRSYGAMLIQTAGRPGPIPLFAPALVELPSLLERRIVAMTTRLPARRRARITAFAGAGALLFVVACELTPRGGSPSPTEPTLADVAEPVGDPRMSEHVVIGFTTDDSLKIASASVSPEGEITVVRVGPDGDTTRLSGMKIRMSPLGDLGRDGPQPLYIVDGQRVASVEGLDPARIAEVNVLKGPIAVERFGAEAGNGVVQIRTGEPLKIARRTNVEPESGATAERQSLAEVERDGIRVEVEKQEPGETRMRISNRGNPDARPLILLDGIRIASVESVDPARIAKIEVIKAASATSAYGPEARDGVILITTKK